MLVLCQRNDQNLALKNRSNVLGHEVTHATGRPSRLNRNMLGKFGTKEYAEEEMIAEFGSVLLLHKFGIALVPPENSVQVLLARVVSARFLLSTLSCLLSV
ncbi:zincin-like metallopeptidase domain-containing protein [Dyadobacter luticola]|uniref:zincin-like metallopeptidase domain-containing protein n=1 Tax=Dyadobacter luticola TaxID=1979387 RepID=UPI00197A7C3D